MPYTVQQLASLAGVSARTLRYYDGIGLLCPQRAAANGYRLYGDAEVNRLQQILFYRALDFELAEIARVLDSPDFDRLHALRTHEAALTLRLHQTTQLLATLTKTIRTLEGDTTMNDFEKFEGFKKELLRKNEEDYGDELRRTYDEETILAANDKLRGLSREEYAEMMRIERELMQGIALALAANDAPDSAAAHAIVALHKRWLCFHWATYTPAAHRGLAALYLLDERFTAYYEKAAPGGAQFLHDAICAVLG